MTQADLNYIPPGAQITITYKTPEVITPPATQMSGSVGGMIGGIFWALIIILTFWFITGGYQQIGQ
jgi:hypothetical protein